ncbi:hypothetical protein BDQ12DRAFT_715432 [Crucibulum laeve]|uniref:G-protein coupled receptors family 1 profile domain-containing protein n=1 Tax=Crucibulum laeve TaxID=68775 RepID=A0A5C3LMY6_9AGAR|nr:hypothetical protein BDQ12DRAFT_715432 [Crucibulum laeve]
MPTGHLDSKFASAFVGAIFLGLYLSTFFLCLRWLLFSDNGWTFRKKISWIMLSASAVLCALDITNNSLSLYEVMSDARSVSQPIPTPATTSSPRLTWNAILMCTNANVSALLADSLLMYRCWIIYEKSRTVLIFPLIFWLGGIACTILEACWQIIENGALHSSWHVVNMTIGPGTVLTPFWASTIILNSYTSTAIIYRIWSVKKEVKSHTSKNQLRFVMRVLIESGSLYLAITIAHLVVWFTPSTLAIDVVSAINLPIIGMTFNLIIMRTSQKRAAVESSQDCIGVISDLQFCVPPPDTHVSKETTGSGDTLVNDTLASEIS